MPSEDKKLQRKIEKLHQTIDICMDLLASVIGLDARYPDEKETEIIVISRKVAELVIKKRCLDRPAVAAAALGYLPYNRDVLKEKVVPSLGRQVARSYRQLAKLRMHSEISRYCLTHECDCENEEGHSELCNSKEDGPCKRHDCILNMLLIKAPYISVSARVALLAWFAFTCKKINKGEKYVSQNWSPQMCTEYKDRANLIAQAVVEKGEEDEDLSPVLQKLADSIKRSAEKKPEHLLQHVSNKICPH